MGIPKFYRWLSERYPLINQPGGATVIPIIDNFYLDMNGIIHNCTHGNSTDIKLTEDEMIVRIFSYLDKLFHIVKPQKVLFMAIDGVAPRAKMNQQRARRFKAAKEAEAAAQDAQRRGEVLSDLETRFDSNCITPGTPFMDRLGAHLRFFIRKKIASDPAWQKPTIVFSGHDVPGEGEHKIMEYIRWAKRSSSYAPNTRHCLYGLDADLVMLSLVTHEPHFCLLREVVSYTGGARGQPAREVLENPCQEHFVLLQIGLLRDYFDLEFKPIAHKLPFQYDLERIVDDFVLFCMLVGNDFLPPLPTCDISESSLDFMMESYRKLLPNMGGYITYAGDLHRGRLEMFLNELAMQESDVLARRAADTEDYEANKARRGQRGAWHSSNGSGGRGGAPPGAAPAAAVAVSATKAPQSSFQIASSILMTDDAEEDQEDDEFGEELALLSLRKEGHELELLAATEGEIDPLTIVRSSTSGADAYFGDSGGLEGGESLEEEGPSEPQGPTMMSREARAFFLNGDASQGLIAWRSRYYGEKIKLAREEDRRRVVESYIQGLHWVLEYYYRGVASWNWFYPYHYAPMASDCTNLQSIKVAFSLGKPFLPYQQLLSVQPGSSCKLLPEPYRWLMTDPTSPIADFYPVDFEVDLEGKRADWEGIVLIPFIDEERLLAASNMVPDGLLSKEEKSRNTLGDIMVFSHREGSKEVSYCVSTLPTHYTSVTQSNSTAVMQAPPPPLPTGVKGFVPQFVAGTKVGATGPPGFPTLRTLAVTGALSMSRVNVFGTPSKKESLILRVKDIALSGNAADSGADDNKSATNKIAAAVLNINVVAAAVVGQRAWVKWPYLQEAFVEAVSDGKVRIEKGSLAKQLQSKDRDAWDLSIANMGKEYITKHGLDVGCINIVLHVRPCEGLVRQLDGSVEKRFSKTECAYPLQMTLRRNPSPDPRFEILGATAAASGEGLFAPLLPGTKALFLGRAHYGCIAEVLPSAGAHGLNKKGEKIGSGNDSKQGTGSGPYRVMITKAPPTAAQAANAARRILAHVAVEYFPTGIVARKLGVSGSTLGRITGNVWVATSSEKKDKVDIGLCVKNASQQLYVPDYCVPLEMTPYYKPESNIDTSGHNAGNTDDQRRKNAGWAYSDKMIRVLEQYKQRFPNVWAAVHDSISHPGVPLHVTQVFPGVDTDTALAQLAAVQKWLKSTMMARRPLVAVGSKIAPESGVRMLQAALPPQPREISTMELENVMPALLLPPLDRGELSAAFAGGTFEIGDRVAAAGGSILPEFGSRGTVIGVLHNDDAIEVLFDKEFIGGTDLYGRCNGACGALISSSQLLNLSKPHAVKIMEDREHVGGGQHQPSLAPRAVKRQPAADGGGGEGSTAGPVRKARGGGAAAALAAATAALQSGNVPRPSTAAPSSIVVAAAAPLPPPKAQPKIPDENGTKGFVRGRGKPPPPPPSPSQAFPVPGAALLARLTQSSQPPPPQRPPFPAPPQAMIMNPHHHGPPLPPPPPHMYPLPPPPPGVMMPMMHMPVMVGQAPSPPFPPHHHVGAAQGLALLAQLQQHTPPTSPSQQHGVGQEGGGEGEHGHSGEGKGNAGAMLLSQLKQGSSDRGVPVLQQTLHPTSEKSGHDDEGENAGNVVPPPPPTPSAALLGDKAVVVSGHSAVESVQKKDADAFWKLLSNSTKKE